MSGAVPREVATSYLLWSAAIAAGIFETVLTVVHATDVGAPSGGALFVAVVLRIVVFLALAYLVAQLWLGRRWSRITLALVPGVFGVLSLTARPAADGAPGLDLMALLIGATRLAHVAAVLGAVVCMYLPGANAYFRAAQTGSVLILQKGETGPVPAPSG